MLSIISNLLNKIKKRELKKYIQWKFSLGNATFASKVCLLKIKNYLKSKNYTQFINLKNNTLAINRDSKIQL